MELNEKILGAAVLASGKIYTGQVHGIAQIKAIEDGAAKITDDGEFVSTDGSPTNINLFFTNYQRLVDRFTAQNQRGISESESIKQQEIPSNYLAAP
jgi:phage I-like protein